jgi:hypothetical protein
VPGAKGISDEALLGERILDRLPTVTEFCLKPDKVKTSEAWELRLLADGSAKIEMPLLQTGSSRSRDVQDSTFCFELLAQLEAHFRFGLTAGISEPKCIFHICKEHVVKLPLLLELVNIASGASPDASKETPANVCTVPFEPPQPASASSLACLLLLLEKAATPLQLFGASSCGPRLAIQCLSVSLALPYAIL